MANYQLAWNAWSHQYYYSNWTINRISLRWMLAKQCLASETAPFNEIVSIPTITQSHTLLANGQYHVCVMAILIVLLLLGCRATTSISKDVDSVADLCKDSMALLKLLHWKNFDYTNIAFTTSCFMIFMALLPLLLTLWLCMLCYRQYIHYKIKVSREKTEAPIQPRKYILLLPLLNKCACMCVLVLPTLIWDNYLLSASFFHISVVLLLAISLESTLLNYERKECTQ